MHRFMMKWCVSTSCVECYKETWNTCLCIALLDEMRRLIFDLPASVKMSIKLVRCLLYETGTMKVCIHNNDSVVALEEISVEKVNLSILLGRWLQTQSVATVLCSYHWCISYFTSAYFWLGQNLHHRVVVVGAITLILPGADHEIRCRIVARSHSWPRICAGPGVWCASYLLFRLTLGTMITVRRMRLIRS